jgi:hypothetical protein
MARDAMSRRMVADSRRAPERDPRRCELRRELGVGGGLRRGVAGERGRRGDDLRRALPAGGMCNQERRSERDEHTHHCRPYLAHAFSLGPLSGESAGSCTVSVSPAAGIL